jgi:hypothetical protein
MCGGRRAQCRAQVVRLHSYLVRATIGGAYAEEEEIALLADALDQDGFTIEAT